MPASQRSCVRSERALDCAGRDRSLTVREIALCSCPHHPRVASALGSPGATAPGFFIPYAHPISWLQHTSKAESQIVVRRHRTYIDALKSTGVDVTLAKFKRKEHLKALAEMRVQITPVRRWFKIPTRLVRLSYRTHEEKETDVAIACKLLELLSQSHCDAVVVVSGDTDIAPAIRTARLLYPHADIGIAFPVHRHNNDLQKSPTAPSIHCCSGRYPPDGGPDPARSSRASSRRTNTVSNTARCSCSTPPPDN